MMPRNAPRRGRLKKEYISGDEALASRVALEEYLGITKNGAPRKYNRDDIALQMLKWSELDTSTNLNGFCSVCVPRITPDTLLDWVVSDHHFAKTYKTVKCIIANRREGFLNTGKLHSMGFQLTAGFYDAFLNKHKRDEKKFEAKLESLKKAYPEKSPEDLATLLEQLLESKIKQEKGDKS